MLLAPAPFAKYTELFDSYKSHLLSFYTSAAIKQQIHVALTAPQHVAPPPDV